MPSRTRRDLLRDLLGATVGLFALRCGGSGQELETHDVCVVGSGPAGALLAADLVRRGVRTLLVESGPRRIGGPAVYERLDVYTSGGEIPYPAASTRVRALGGTSTVWTGHCLRLHPTDLAAPSRDEAAAWPVSYRELEPWYLAAERELRVQGGEATPFSPPRSAPYPLPTDPRRDPARLRALLAAAGVSAEALPLAVVGDGPIRLAKSHVPEVEETRPGTLLTGSTVTRIAVGAGGRVSHLEARDLEGGRRFLRARHYVLAGGGIETPRLVLLSRAAGAPLSPDAPDRIGRFFMEHLVVAGSAIVPGSWDPASPDLKSVVSHQFAPLSKREGLGAVVVKFFQSAAPGGAQEDSRLDVLAELEMEPSPGNRVSLDSSVRDLFGDPGARIFLSPSARDRATIAWARELVATVLTRAGGHRIEVTNQVSWAHHHMGTCRSGEDPRASVADPELRVRGTENLYLAGGAPFPTAGAASPTLTICALALRLAESLAAGLGM